MANPLGSHVGSLSLTVLWYTEGDGEDRGVRFRLLPTTPLERVMRAWCDQNQVAMAEVCFVWNRRFVFRDGTMVSLNMLNENGPVITAAPLRPDPEAPLHRGPETNG